MESATITAEKIVSGGNCISKIEGKTVFVPYAIPGERLRIHIEKEMRDYSLACIDEILEGSEHRVSPVCPLYQKCGGCNMQHIDSAFQKELRACTLKDAFLREGIELESVKVVGADDFGYRARFQLHNGGLMAKQSNDIVPLDFCPCAVPEINAYLQQTS